MKLAATKFVLLLVLVVCFVSTKVLANHHHKHDDDCDHDDDEDWDEDNDWEDEDWEDDKWNDNWDNDRDGRWSGNNNWGNGRNGQNWGTGLPPSGSIVAGGTTIWSGSGWPMPTNSYGQPPYPTHATPGVVTATWTQVIPTGNPTNIRSEPQYGNDARYVKLII